MSRCGIAVRIAVSRHEGNECLLKPKLNLQHARAVSGYWRKDIVEHVADLDGRNPNMRTVDLGVDLRSFEAPPLRQQSNGTPDDVDRCAWIIDGG